MGLASYPASLRRDLWLAALFALVSRDRLEVWVAMVIVSRELAVTLSLSMPGASPSSRMNCPWGPFGGEPLRAGGRGLGR